MIGQLLKDLRYAGRTLYKRPGFTAVAVTTLALGIGANTAVFSVVYGILLRPLSYDAADELVSVWPDRFVSYSEVEAFEGQARSLRQVGGVVMSWNAALTGEGEPAQLIGARPTVNLFSLLGASAVLGRAFAPEDGVLGAEPVVLLSHRVWLGRFGGDSGIVGRRVALDGALHTVIGVMPPDFELVRSDTEIWQPLVRDPEEWYFDGQGILAIGRLSGGTTVRQADEEFGGVVEALQDELGLPDDYSRSASIVPLKDRLVGGVRAQLLVLLGAVGLILLIAGANLGNLLLARATGRTREIAVRSALGAGRGRLITQLLTESAVLAVAGGLAGLVVAAGGIQAITALLPPNTPRLDEIGLNLQVLAACALLAIGSGLAFGLAPALVTARSDLQGVLRSSIGTAGAAGPGGRRLRAGFVVAEVALALTLTVGAGLMVRTLWNLAQVDPGFEPENVLSLRVQPTGERVRSWEQRRVFYREVFGRLEALPGVSSVGAIQHLPLSGGSWGSAIDIEGQPREVGESAPTVGWRVVSEGYFRSMRIPVLQGRLFDSQDGPGSPPVVVVNDALARRFWPGEDPLGRQLRAERATGGEWATVVGVVGNVRHARLEDDAVPEMYRPLEQYTHGGMTLTVRTAGPPAALAGAVQRTIWLVDPDVPISHVRTVEQVMSESTARPRLIMTLLGAFAAVGLLLGAVGVYGVIAYTVGQRRREIAVRMALGASPHSVVTEVVSRGVRYAAVGAAIGIAGALLLTRLMSSLVFGVQVNDPLTLVATTAFVMVVAAFSSLIPARGAARVDPMVALREE